MRITKAMLMAMQTYYFNRLRQSKEHPWDKQADLEAIDQAAHKAGWMFSAGVGSFWLSYNTKLYRVTYYTSIDLFPKFTISREKRTREATNELETTR